MHICLHIGAHYTDDDHLVKSLLKNTAELSKHGVAVPGPGKYRDLLSNAQVKLKGAPADDETQEFLLDAFVDHDDAERLVMGHKHLLGVEARALEQNQLYYLAARNPAWQRNLFPDHRVTFFMGMRNPASYIVEALKSESGYARDEKLASINPIDLRWSNVIQMIRNAVPDSQVAVWCNEDTPYIWPDVMRAITGVGAEFQFKGADDILTQIMLPEGITRMYAYLRSHPPKSESQKKRVQEAFLEKFAIMDKIEQEIDLPGWTQNFVDELTAQYEEDVDYIAAMPGVTLITG